MQIDQLVHTLNYGDAISNEALSIKRLLNRRGIKSRIFSVHAHPKIKQEASDPELLKAEPSGTEQALILHYSIASPLNTLFAETTGRKRLLIYHNLTPPRWYESYNARVTADLRVGLAELPALLKLADKVIADSTYNKQELAELGRSDAEVLPLLIDNEKWGAPANPGIAGVLKGHGGRNVLAVGRLAPNKRLEDVIKAFYFYHFKIEKQSRLWIIGSDIDNEIYSFELRRLVSRLHLKEAVNFVGTVADSELRAFYENSDVYLSMSEHEGFCAPLIEAMHFNLPVIAFDACAVAETVGSGGILIAEKDPGKLAELINLTITDTELRKRLIEQGKKQAASFGEEPFEARLNELVIAPLTKK